MARKPLEPGEAGNFRCTREGQRHYRARCRYRDHRGTLREVERQGPSEVAAYRALDEAIESMKQATGRFKGLTKESFVNEAIDYYWAEIKKQIKSPNTFRLYKSMIDRFIQPRLGNLRIRQCSVGLLNEFLMELYTEKGYSTYKTTRTITSRLFGLICRHDAMTNNPVRDTAQINNETKEVKALEIEQIHELRTKLAQDQQAINRDLPDFIDFMLGTGVRISEAAAVLPECLGVDEEQPYVDIEGMVIREAGHGLRIKRDANSKLNIRRLNISPSLAAMLRRRLETTDPGTPIFPAPLGGLRDPSNTQADLRDAFAKAGFRTETLQLTSHAFRRSLATAMDRAGKDKGIKSQLGHRSENMKKRYVKPNPITGAEVVSEQFFQ
jgi:integrase